MFKILFGVIGDSVPLCGSKKRSWLIVMGLTQALALATVAALGSNSTPTVITAFLSLSNAAGAWMDASVDGLMVIQARRDPEKGAVSLQSLAWCFLASGMLVGSAVAGVITDKLNPSYCFLIYSGFGLLVAINAMCLPSDIEQEEGEDVSSASFSQTCTAVGESFKIPPLKRMLIFFVIMGCTIPAFMEFMYFF